MEIQQARTLGHWLRIARLYYTAFPRGERKPLSMIRRRQKENRTDVWYFTENGKFIGIGTTVNDPEENMILLDYFAITRKSRSKGCGTRILPMILSQYPGRKVFGEIEIADEGTENYDQRIRRKQFYLRNGMRALDIYVDLFGVEMEILTSGCDLTIEEYLEFYRKNIGEFALDHVKQIRN